MSTWHCGKGEDRHTVYDGAQVVAVIDPDRELPDGQANRYARLLVAVPDLLVLVEMCALPWFKGVAAVEARAILARIEGNGK